ncbi:hypothetical protein FC682_24465 [Peribacillus simplex]|uniref:hypothetical protein n=1 Tax=Peribacillus simplex TaxID=1478 RepID=UPI0010BE36F5|nr:hypothetical protein [Peribacillus simplex]TKH00253.1 hypothetical protein FC682_24465 [Peribacillus simplex]
MEWKVRDSCGESVAKGDPAGERRGGSWTARGKRVPGVEIITHILFQKSAPFSPTVCQELITEVKRPVVPSLLKGNFPKKIRLLPFARLRMKAV